MSRDVVVLSAARSAIGAFAGGLSHLEPQELGGIIMKAAVERSGVDPRSHWICDGRKLYSNRCSICLCLSGLRYTSRPADDVGRANRQSTVFIRLARDCHDRTANHAE